MLLTRESRDLSKSEFNNAVQSYTRQTYDFLISSVTVSFGPVALSKVVSKLPVKGNVDGVLVGDHVTFELIEQSPAASYGINVQVGDQLSMVTTMHAISRSAAVDLACSSSARCSASIMMRKCTDEYQGVYHAASNGRCNLQNCGYCAYTQYLQEVCVPVVRSGNTFSLSTQYTSCYHPFTEHVFNHTATSVRIVVMTEDDPKIVLERVTAGANEFLWSESRQKGLPVVIIGAVLIVCTCIAFGVVLYSMRHNADSNPTVGVPAAEEMAAVRGEVVVPLPVGYAKRPPCSPAPDPIQSQGTSTVQQPESAAVPVGSPVSIVTPVTPSALQPSFLARTPPEVRPTVDDSRCITPVVVS